MDWDEIDTKFEEFKSFPVEQRSLIDKELKIDALEIENLLESNSLTRSEISVLLKSGLSIGGKDFIDHLETVNHSDAYDWVIKRPAPNRFSNRSSLSFTSNLTFSESEWTSGAYVHEYDFNHK